MKEIMISEDLIWKVLLYLPTKSLMRFKCVSKHWYSIIRNPKFALEWRSIGGGTRYLLIEDYPGLWYVNLNDDHTRLMKHNVAAQGVQRTPVVEGIMGWYDYGADEFTLFNVTTHELLRLSLPPIPPDFGEVYINYSLGYDPTNKVFKVLCLCTYPIDSDQEANLNLGMDAQLTYVFTFGAGGTDMDWRMISPAPFLLCLARHYVCTDGVMYWVLWDQQSLVAFHLNNETFETIAVPQDLPDPDDPDDTKYNCSLGEICGRPALVDVHYHSGSLDVWMMNENCGELWTKKSVLFPKSIEPVYPIPTEKVMLVDHQERLFGRRICALYIIFYDHLKNLIIFPITFGGVSEKDSWYHGYNHRKMSYYEENIICLRQVINN